MSVTALLVSHHGDRWLPQVLERLAGQSVPPDTVVAVDTGPLGESADVLRDGLPPGSVVLEQPGASYPAAVDVALAALGGAADAAPGTVGDAAEDWIWLLHDDSAPAPDALEHLLAARGEADGPAVLGPKIREWPSLRRLLEVGVTITGTGRRESGLERGEYDQGQHDEPRDVLAVNSAGMLVRRSVLEQLGFDHRLPVFHADLDFGWRAARAGHRVRTAPDAVVFHAEASRTGLRRPERDRATRRRLEREAALYTVLANCAAAAVPLVAVRLVLGTLLRALGLLLVRAPREAWAELGALGSTVLRSGRLVAARRSRRVTARVGPGAVRPLLAPFWLPYRTGLDELAAIGAAVLGEAGARTGTAEGGPSLGRRLRTSPAVWVVAVLVLLSTIAARDLLEGGRLTGGALLPAPGSATAWWDTYLSTTHEVSTGSSVTAPAYLLPMAVLATVLLGSASLAVDLLVLGAVPVAGAGALRLLRRRTGSAAASVWGAVGYALLLATSGALAQGRLGTLVAGALLPWMASTALGLTSGSADRRRRAAWRTGLWLALLTAFAPVAWLLAAGAAVVGLVAAAVARRLDVGLVGLVLLPLPVSAVLLLPWSALVWRDRGWSAVLLEAGLPASALVGPVRAADVLGARAGDLGAAPAWLAAVLGVLALLALLGPRTRGRVVGCWLVALVGLTGVWALTGVEIAEPFGGGTVVPWAGLPLLLLHGAWIAAAVVAAGGIGGSTSARSLGWRQPVALLVTALALVLPLSDAAWWLGHGSDDPLVRVEPSTVPAYMDSAAERDPAEGTLVLRGGPTDGITTEVRRGAPLSLGEETLVVPDDAQMRLTETVGDLVTAPRPATTTELARSGVAFVFAPAPVDPELASALDVVPTLASASADDPDARAWRVDEETRLPRAEPAVPTWLRPLLLGVQALALLAVVVLAAPTRRGRP